MFVEHIKGTKIKKSRVLKEGEKRFSIILTDSGYEYKFEPEDSWIGENVNAVRRVLRQAYALQKYSLTKRSL
tara:strand:+ start:28517 stop:28732 length:216 start_codon:yes stop_codon:yes gene_type:complete